MRKGNRYTCNTYNFRDDGVVEIVTTAGIILVDRDDFDLVSKYTWWATRNFNKKVWYGRAVFPKAGGSQGSIRIHRLILGAEYGQFVDHINGNGLDNTRKNLRFTDRAGNTRNTPPKKNNRTGYKGVTPAKNGRYMAHIALGTFDTAEDAARAFDQAAHLLFGDRAWLNFTDKVQYGSKYE